MILAFEKVMPSNWGSKVPFKPAMRVESRMYVTKAMSGMYMSGALISSRGGAKVGPEEDAEEEELGECEEEVVRDQGRWRQGKMTRRVLRRT